MGNLFSGKDLPGEARERMQDALTSIHRASVDELLSRDVDVLIDTYVIPFEPATVRWDDVTMTEPKQFSSGGSDVLGRAITQQGATSTLKVPVDGDSMLLTYRSHSGAPYMSNIEGTVKPGSLEFQWRGNLNAPPQEIHTWFAQRQAFVEQFLANNNRDVPNLNAQMRNSIKSAIEARRAQELARRKLAASLPFPVERKPGATLPVHVQRKTVRVQPRPAPAPFMPEPELDRKTYEEILRDCVAMATIFERMPLGPDTHEEHLRNMILAMLNTNYNGQVGGEVFNGAGKTDILMRYEDRNVFIGECKVYRGPKSVTDAVDQLLGYLVWRDTKAALLVFVEGGSFTQVVTKVVDAVREHPQCLRVRSDDPTRRSDFLFTRSDDPDRAIHLAVLPFQMSV